MVGLSKGLRAEFAMKQANIGVTVVCPGGVSTAITSQLDTTGPGGKPREDVTMAPEVEALFNQIDQTVETGVSSDEVGEMICRAILENQFWVLPNAECYFPVLDHELAEIKAGIKS
jgi:short-subunit dehydrogenase